MDSKLSLTSKSDKLNMRKEVWIATFAVLFVINVADAEFNNNRGPEETRSVKEQIAAAVSPAPKALRADAKVYGYNENGEFVTLREANSSTEIYCISDKPGDDKFHVACYYKELEPFMARGRALRKQGYNHAEVDSIRRVEIKAGKLKMWTKPSALYSITGPADSFDYEAMQVEKGKPLYVVYIPHATPESTGLVRSPMGKGAPWIMEPGTPWAHIMIMPGVDFAKENNDE